MWATIYSMFLITIQQYEPDTYEDASIPYAALVFFIAFIILSMIMMLNIFIAMINATYSRNIANKRSQLTFAVFPRSLFFSTFDTH